MRLFAGVLHPTGRTLALIVRVSQKDADAARNAASAVVHIHESQVKQIFVGESRLGDHASLAVRRSVVRGGTSRRTHSEQRILGGTFSHCWWPGSSIVLRQMVIGTATLSKSVFDGESLKS